MYTVFFMLKLYTTQHKNQFKMVSKSKSVTLTFRLSLLNKVRIGDIAASKGRTASSLVATIIEDYIEKEIKKSNETKSKGTTIV